MADTINNGVPNPVMIYGRAPNGTLQAVTTDGLGNISFAGAGGAPTFPVNAQTANYTATAADFSSFKIITMKATAGSLVLTLPATAPTTSGQGIFIQNLNTTNVATDALTINRNGLTIDGVAANLTLGPNSGITIVSDGVNYVTNRGVAGFWQIALNGTGGMQYSVSQVSGSSQPILSVLSGAATNYTNQTLTFSNVGGGQTYYLSNGGDAIINTVGSIEAAAPAGLASTDKQFADSVTHTWGHNSNNNGTMSFSGAWVNTNVTPVTVNANTAAAQNLMSVSIPAGTLNRVGRSLRIWLSGVYSLTAVASTTTIAVKLGALTLVSIVDTSVATGITNGQFNLLAHATVQTSGASGALEPHGNLTIELGATGAVADSVFADSNTATVGTVDLTAAQTLQVTVTFSNASASNSATQRQMVLETVG